MTYEALKGLKPEDFEHPGEKAAMAVLRKIPLLDIAVSKFMDMQLQLRMIAEASGGYFRVTEKVKKIKTKSEENVTKPTFLHPFCSEKTNPRLYHLYQLALARLDMPKEYPLFCKLGYDYNAYTTGVEDPIVVIHSSTVANTDGEMLHLLGHELGHIKCGHLLYYQLANQINAVLASFGGIAATAAAGLQYAIMDWNRKAEYSADRAGLIAAADLDAVLDETMIMLGRSDKIPDMNFSADAVMKQIDDFEMGTSDFVGMMLYAAFTAQASHPWSILRLRQLKDWYDSGEYAEVVQKYL